MVRDRLARYGPLVPNTLTVLRLGVAVTFPFAPVAWRLTMVLVGGVSDALDGLAARRLHATTWVGALLDGIADKLFTLSVLLTLTAAGPLSWLQLGLLLTRDAVVALIAAYVGVAGQWEMFKRVAARPSGKVTTAALFAMFVVILWRPSVGRPLVWIAVASSLLAAADYAIVFVRWKVWQIEPGHLRS
ncbi:MAG: CDP-alcohol phosphatidyltransferase family protein [Gemmatimonadota bacterium]|jgi:phosphatidylglycerophosphate synthase